MCNLTSERRLNVYKVDKLPINPNHPLIITLVAFFLLFILIGGDSGDLILSSLMFTVFGFYHRYHIARIDELDERVSELESRLETCGQSDELNRGRTTTT